MKLLCYIFLISIASIDIVLLVLGLSYCLSIEPTVENILLAVIGFIFYGLIILILTADVVSWVERRLHE